MSDSRSRQPRSADQPSAQGDSSPEPVYTAEFPEVNLQVRLRVELTSVWPQSEDSDAAEAGYGHGV